MDKIPLEYGKWWIFRVTDLSILVIDIVIN